MVLGSPGGQLVEQESGGAERVAMEKKGAIGDVPGPRQQDEKHQTRCDFQSAFQRLATPEIRNTEKHGHQSGDHQAKGKIAHAL